MLGLFLNCLVTRYQAENQLIPTKGSLDGCFTKSKQYLRENQIVAVTMIPLWPCMQMNPENTFNIELLEAYAHKETRGVLCMFRIAEQLIECFWLQAENR